MKITFKLDKEYHPSGYKGEMNISFNEIISVFGQPNSVIPPQKSPDNKVSAEWMGKINGLPFRIYDYCTGRHYRKNREWHIGGLGDEVVTLIGQLLKTKTWSY